MMEIHQLGSDVIRQHLGSLRSLASQAAHNDVNIDEEKFFEKVTYSFLKGIKTEVTKLFGATKTSKLLDPFYGRTKRS